MTKLSLKLGSPDPEDGFSYPNRSHIMSRTEFKEIDFFSFFFEKKDIFQAIFLPKTLTRLRKAKFLVSLRIF